jgi:hypothetical protein
MSDRNNVRTRVVSVSSPTLASGTASVAEEPNRIPVSV